jgi:hypothetical protein
MMRRDWLAGAASIAFLAICFTAFRVLTGILEDNVHEFVIYIIGFIIMGIALFGSKAIGDRIKSGVERSQSGEDELGH